MAEGTTTTVANEGLPEYIDPYVRDLFSRGQALTSSNPAPVYGGNRTAGLTYLQQAAGQSVSGLDAGNMMSQGAGLTQQGGQYTPSVGTFGLDAAREPDGFAKVAMRLSEYRKIEPGALEEALFFDHPSGRTRVQMAMEWKAKNVPNPQVVRPEPGYLDDADTAPAAR